MGGPQTQALSPPASDGDAETLFQNAYSRDPLPGVGSFLLNSSDIYDYVCAAGMLYPFEESQLKAASYAVRIGKKVIYWDGVGVCVDKDLKEGEAFEVLPNSIVFVTTKEKFRLPLYMVARFNLKIKNVHRGFLLGTGPMVDPGYKGNLLIPLHNLTTKPYFFKEGEPFIWAEFTKTSMLPEWAAGSDSGAQLPNHYKPFPKNRWDIEPWEYLKDHAPIRSSIPDALQSAARKAESAEKSAKRSRSFSSATLVVLLLTALALVGGEFQLIDSLEGKINANHDKLQELQQANNLHNERAVINGELTELQNEISSLQKSISTAHGDKQALLNAEMARLKVRLTKLRADLQKEKYPAKGTGG